MFIMKKCIIIILINISIIWAEKYCKMDIPLGIYFKDSEIWFNENSFKEGCYTVVDDTLSEKLADGYKCLKKESEKAFLDSNIFLYRNVKSTINSIRTNSLSIYTSYEISNNIYSRSLANHSIDEIFKDEFMHWQQCGMLSLTYEEADSMATSIIMAIKRFGDELDCTDADKFYVCDGPSPTEQIAKWVEESCSAEGLNLPNSPLHNYCDDEEFLNSADWLREACGKESLIHFQNTANASIVFEKGIAHIPEHLRGESYLIFDMNGRIIKKGNAGEMIRMPDSPAILKIGIEKPILLK